MSLENRAGSSSMRSEAGMALPAVLLITFLLLMASIAMIKAAGANSVNTSDVLAETKAYYAADSGIQAAVNILRNQNVDYKEAVNQDNGTLIDWQLSEDIRPEGAYHSMGTEAEIGYAIKVSDPDNAQTQISFTTDTSGGLYSGFSVMTAAGVLSNYEESKRIERDPVDPANYSVIRWVPEGPSTPILFSGEPFVTHTLGKFQITAYGAGASRTVYFRINFRLAAPDNPTWVIQGQISPSGSVAFTSSAYRMLGSDIWLCSTPSSCPSTAPAAPAMSFTWPTAPGPPVDVPISVRLTPFEPQRLLIRSVGYGPNKSRKVLEAIIKKSFFPLVPPVAGILMNGSTILFDNGNGRPQYNGCDPANPSVCVPSFGVMTPAALAEINTDTFDAPPPSGCVSPCLNPYPAPAIVGEDVPEWQKTPLAMDQMISQWRNATPVGSLYTANATLSTGDYGDYTNGTGLTFCDANCTIQGEGGGILVVKGKLTTFGGVRFRGYIIVVGAEGIVRNGNGGADDEIIGGIVIAPYVLTPSPGMWLPASFDVNGGGTSRVTYSGLDFLFDGGMSGTTNFVVGIAEK